MPSPSLPALFISHGAPLFAVDAGESGPALGRLGLQIRQRAGRDLRGVVIMSPHWTARSPSIMSNPKPDTWHDFGGFPPALYQLAYPAPGAPELSVEVAELLREQGIEVHSDPKRPLDHGAWVPLMHLFPQADVPVVQLALPTDYTPQSLMAMGAALASLRARGVLIIGSGSLTHNLHEFMQTRPALHAAPAGYVGEFARWIENAVTHNDTAALLGYRQHAPHATQAHPTDEHFATIYFALGAAGWATSHPPTAHYISREVMYRYLAMDAFALD